MRKTLTTMAFPGPTPTSLDAYLELAVGADYFRRKDQLGAFLRDYQAGANPIFICGSILSFSLSKAHGCSQLASLTHFYGRIFFSCADISYDTKHATVSYQGRKV